LGERLGSGDGERKASMTRQMPFEPLPASVLFALGWLWMAVIFAKWYLNAVGKLQEKTMLFSGLERLR
jgi:hypothetical protein